MSFPHSAFLIAVLSLSLWACAKQGTPTGGPRDTTPPKVDSLRSSRNFITRYNEKKFELAFDEWVELKDVSTQLIVSPPLQKRPNVTLKGKKVIVDLSQSGALRPNTTYTFNFGASVVDLHEGNPAKDLRYVFSTGDVIDSLSIFGSVADAFTGEPVENVTVMLYDQLGDSVVRKELPYYYARTDKSGQFSIKNIRPGLFKCVAVDEGATPNLKWDSEAERIGFPDSLVRIDHGYITPVVGIRIFKDQAALRLADRKTNRYGVVGLYYTRPPEPQTLQTDPPGIRILREAEQDSVKIWYDIAQPADWKLISGSDTVVVKSLSRDEFMEKHRQIFADDQPVAPVSAGGQRGRNARPAPNTPAAPPPDQTKTIALHPFKTALLSFRFPVSGVDTALWEMTLDSLPFRDFNVEKDSASIRGVRLSAAWKGNKIYRLNLLPGAVIDFWGKSNTDTLRRILSIAPEKSLGGLNLTAGKLKPGVAYVVQLLNGLTMEEQRVFTAETTEMRLVFKNLPATAYTVQLIEDKNKNGRWDTGRYFERRTAEPVFTKKLESLRANWEVEAQIEAAAQGSGAVRRGN